jgi:hypothetical protein
MTVLEGENDMISIHPNGFFVLVSLCCLFIVHGGCAAQQAIVYSYADGSGNTYVITASKEKSLEFNPVKPEVSSSGHYDGGDYVKKIISDAEYDTIIKAINEAIDNKAIHIENRLMKSGLITVKKDKDEARYIIAPDSKEQLHIEEVLKEIRDRAE